MVSGRARKGPRSGHSSGASGPFSLIDLRLFWKRAGVRGRFIKSWPAAAQGAKPPVSIWTSWLIVWTVVSLAVFRHLPEAYLLFTGSTQKNHNPSQCGICLAPGLLSFVVEKHMMDRMSSSQIYGSQGLRKFPGHSGHLVSLYWEVWASAGINESWSR